MTIYQIKELTKETSPYFFSRSTLRFFGQTMRSFSVKKQADGRYRVSAPSRDYSGTLRGETVRFFNPKNNELEHQ